MTSVEGSSRSARGLLSSVGASWMRAPYPALVVDALGSVVEINARAADLFPAAIPGTALAE
ncbi:serine/threonine protein phosphatase, partial [Streptomyces sp. SID10815]|nr:serine/threonine protein phosphatase [Streptomyces sp. SID10815]